MIPLRTGTTLDRFLGPNDIVEIKAIWDSEYSPHSRKTTRRGPHQCREKPKPADQQPPSSNRTRDRSDQMLASVAIHLSETPGLISESIFYRTRTYLSVP